MRGALIAVLAASALALSACHARETSVGLAQRDGQTRALILLRGETTGQPFKRSWTSSVSMTRLS
jgi:hypothetical protein